MQPSVRILGSPGARGATGEPRFSGVIHVTIVAAYVEGTT